MTETRDLPRPNTMITTILEENLSNGILLWIVLAEVTWANDSFLQILGKKIPSLREDFLIPGSSINLLGTKKLSMHV